MRILGIPGSLRKQSINRGLLLTAQELAPAGCLVEIFDLKEIPLFNQDDEQQLPQRVVQLKEAIRSADALLIACAEYNYSVSGVLKNALDWGSRPYGQNAWEGKPVAIMGASPSPQGSARAQYHLRQILLALNMRPLNRPELMITATQGIFNTEGLLVDEAMRKRVAALLSALLLFQSTQRGG